jgi:trehalose 6-phosphate phosphatase
MDAMDAHEIVTALHARLPDVLVALDFDGTLAPLVTDPQASRPVPGTVDALRALSATGARVAIITGRDAGTAVRLGNLDTVPGIVVAGLYGIETWHDGALETPDTPGTIDMLRTQLPSVLADDGADPDLWIEDKRLSLVVHARRAANPEAALDTVREQIYRVAEELGLEVHPGRDVLELRLPGYDKAGALCRLAGDRAGVLYVGDDLGDLPAFAEIRRLRAAGRTAYGVGVLSSGVDGIAEAADVHVADPAAAVEVLRALAG